MPRFDHPHFSDPLVALLLCFAPLFGACVGSFLNVVVYRLPRDHLSIAWPGSHCFFCGTMLRWFENIPILSYLGLGGRCAHCRATISPVYLVTEVLVAALFFALTWAFLGQRFAFERFADPGYGPVVQGLVLAAYLALASALVAASWIDFRHRLIPDEISIGGAIVALVFIALVPAALAEDAHLASVRDPHWAALGGAALGAAVGAITIWAVGEVGKLMFRKDAMGMGDAKLMALLGAVLGWKAVLISMFLACVLGSVCGGSRLTFAWVWRLVTRGKGPLDHYIPFGPCLALGAMITLVFRSGVVGLFLQFALPPPHY